jgi:hypothetical protein
MDELAICQWGGGVGRTLITWREWRSGETLLGKPYAITRWMANRKLLSYPLNDRKNTVLAVSILAHYVHG